MSASRICVAVPNFFPLVTLPRVPKRTDTFFILLTQLHQISFHGGRIKFGHVATIQTVSQAMKETTLIKQSATWWENSFFMCLPLGGPKCWNDLVNWTFPLHPTEFQLWCSSCSCRPECQWCTFHHQLVIYIKYQSDTLFAELPQTHSLITIKHVGPIWIIEGEAEHYAEWWRQSHGSRDRSSRTECSQLSFSWKDCTYRYISPVFSAHVQSSWVWRLTFPSKHLICTLSLMETFLLLSVTAKGISTSSLHDIQL